MRGGWGPPGPNPGPMPLPMPGPGRNPWWGGHRNTTRSFGTYWPTAPAFATPLCASPLFPLAPNCSTGDAGASDYYPQESNAPPAINLFVSPPALPLLPPPEPSAGQAAGENRNPVPAASHEVTQAATSQHQEVPVRTTAADESYPPVLVLRTGGMYSITRYWTKGKTLYFETTAGDTLYAPLDSLDRVIAGSKPIKRDR